MDNLLFLGVSIVGILNIIVLIIGVLGSGNIKNTIIEFTDLMLKFNKAIEDGKLTNEEIQGLIKELKDVKDVIVNNEKA